VYIYIYETCCWIRHKHPIAY